MEIQLYPKVGCDVIDVTAQVKAVVADHGTTNGLVTIFSPHTTTAICINENDPGLLADFKHNLERSIPADLPYEHNKIDDRQNARAHLASLVYGASQTVPVIDGQLALGRWQSIFFIDFDGGRPDGRRVIVSVK